MVNFQPGAGAVVAADSKNAVAAVDDALLNNLRMYASFIEATQGSNLPAAQSQKVYKSLSASLSAIVEGRADIVAAIRQLNFIKGASNLRELDFGCPLWLEASPGPTAVQLAEKAGATLDA